MKRSEIRDDHPDLDIFIIGGGVNGVGIARDAAGRGLSVALAERGDLASATSSCSTKLFHGGLRYLEYFELRLVRESLREREILLEAMPHIAWPLRFVLPIHRNMRFGFDTPASRFLARAMPWMKGRRPAWMIRLALLVYDHLGGRKILPGTTALRLDSCPEGAPLDGRFHRAFEYSDCWVDDARLVLLNARDAATRGAMIMTGTEVIGAQRHSRFWEVKTRDDEGKIRTQRARLVINAAGPWVNDVLRKTLGVNTADGIRLVRGSHLVIRRLYDHAKCYILQGTDGRIVFTIPFETDFTIIGTTEVEHDDPDIPPTCTPEEADYLLEFISAHFRKTVRKEDVIWSYSGLRPLIQDDTPSATAATRDYMLRTDTEAAPVLSVYGGKITTYRKLAESVLDEIAPLFPHMGGTWTARTPLPGGDFPIDGVQHLVDALRHDYPFLDNSWATRLIRTYGTDTRALLAHASCPDDLGKNFGATITARELDWAVKNEWVRTSADYLWRRTKLGLRTSATQARAIDDYLQQIRFH